MDPDASFIGLDQALLPEPEALELLGNLRFNLGNRIMDAKAQLVAEYVKTIRIPGYFPPIKEFREQLVQAVDLLDEPEIRRPLGQFLRTRALTSPEPVRKFWFQTKDRFSRPVPVRNTSPEPFF